MYSNFYFVIPEIIVIECSAALNYFSRENEILRGIFHVIFRFPLHFMLYRENLDYIFNSA